MKTSKQLADHVIELAASSVLCGPINTPAFQFLKEEHEAGHGSVNVCDLAVIHEADNIIIKPEYETLSVAKIVELIEYQVDTLNNLLRSAAESDLNAYLLSIK